MSESQSRDVRPAWMNTADEVILRDLRAEQPDYAPLVASRLGMLPDYVDDRCEELVENGFIERLSDEVVYRVTKRGERYLDGDLDTSDFERT
ncbi:MAG: MarR family transcriptional regulator [Haloferacaceae archaeon]